MARLITVWELNVKGNAKTELKETGEAADKAKDKAGGFGKFLSERLKDAAAMVYLARAGMDALRGAIGATIEKALAFRFPDDLGLRQIEALGRNLELTGARIGDVFIPIIQGIATVAAPMLDQLRDWLRVNDKMVSSEIIDWLHTFADILANVLLAAVVEVVQGWYTMKMAIAAIRGIFDLMVSETLSGLGAILDSLGRVVALKEGMEGVGASMRSAGKEVAGLSSSFKKSAIEAHKSFVESSLALNDFEKGADKVQLAVAEAFARIDQAARKHLEDPIKRSSTVSREEIQKILAQQAQLRTSLISSAALFQKMHAAGRVPPGLQDEYAALQQAIVDIAKTKAARSEDALSRLRERIAEFNRMLSDTNAAQEKLAQEAARAEAQRQKEFEGKVVEGIRQEIEANTRKYERLAELGERHAGIQEAWRDRIRGHAESAAYFVESNFAATFERIDGKLYKLGDAFRDFFANLIEMILRFLAHKAVMKFFEFALGESWQPFSMDKAGKVSGGGDFFDTIGGIAKVAAPIAVAAFGLEAAPSRGGGIARAAGPTRPALAAGATLSPNWNIAINTVIPPDSAQTTKAVRDGVSRALRDLHRRGA